MAQLLSSGGLIRNLNYIVVHLLLGTPEEEALWDVGAGISV